MEMYENYQKSMNEKQQGTIAGETTSHASASSNQQQEQGNDDQPAGDDLPHDDSDGDDDGDGDDEPDDDELGESTITVFVKKCFGDSYHRTKEFEVSPKWRVSSLRFLVMQQFRVAVQHQRFTKVSGNIVFHNLTFEANGVKHGQTLNLLLCLDGGVKRTRKTQDDEDDNEPHKSPKELKQEVNDGLLKLENMTQKTQIVIDVIDRARLIINTSQENPRQVISSLIQHLPRNRLSTLMTGTVVSSTRAMTRVKFVSETSLPEVFEALDNLGVQERVCKKTLCTAVRYAISCEFSLSNGQTDWAGLTKCLADKIIEPPADNAGGNGGRCILM